MASAGYIERDVAGLGSEPPPEVVVDEDADTVPPELPETPTPGPPTQAGSPTPSEVPEEAPPRASPTPVTGDTTPPPSKE
jgi:hypothetical protein